VVDNSGCQRDFPVTITFPGFISTSAVAITPPDCISNGVNGSISFTIFDIGTFEFALTTDPLYVPVPADYLPTGGPFVVIPNLTNGTYFVWLKSAGSVCPTRLGPIDVVGVFTVSFTATATDEICFGDGGTIILNNITGASGLDYTYELVLGGVPTVNPITFLESLGPYTISGLAPGNYQIRLSQDQTTLNGCVATTAFQSFVIDGPVASLGFQATENIKESFPDQPTGSMLVVIQESMEEPYQLKVELTGPLVGGQFFLRDFQTMTRNTANLRIQEQFIALFAGTYTLTVRDGLGCERSINVDIPVDTDIFIPNIFTPNGDGVNDSFFIRNLPEGSKLIISNRWGKEVYSSNNYPVAFNDPKLWNGGNESDGVYYYRLQAGSKVFTGWVEVLRGSKP
jgi:gliding motility-associated-like protein